MGVAVGSSIQIALFVIPFMTILGWIMDKPLSLLFDPFESVVSAVRTLYRGTDADRGTDALLSLARPSFFPSLSSTTLSKTAGRTGVRPFSFPFRTASLQANPDVVRTRS